MQFKRLAIVAAFALAGLSTAAQAVIVNIDATTATPTTQTFAAGTYDFAVIGTAQGGAYDGWTFNTSGLFREAFTGSFGSTTYTVDHYSSTGAYYQNYATASDALSSFASGPYAVIYNGSISSMSVMQLTFDAPTTVAFSVPDNVFTDNTGGVSLSVTSAVPEPETYAMLLAGLGAMGFIARRRRAA